MELKEIQELNEDTTPLDKWFSGLCFREKLMILGKYEIEDWFNEGYYTKKSIYDMEVGA